MVKVEVEDKLIAELRLLHKRYKDQKYDRFVVKMALEDLIEQTRELSQRAMVESKNL